LNSNLIVNLALYRYWKFELPFIVNKGECLTDKDKNIKKVECKEQISLL
jgi:hypothetical protein